MKKLLVPGLLSALLAGCAVGPNYKQPTLAVPEQYREVQGPPAPGESLADLPWWETFKDPALKSLIDEALLHGYDVRIAASRVDEARARAGIAKSQFFPQISYGGGVSRGMLSGSTTDNRVSANVNFGWEHVQQEESRKNRLPGSGRFSSGRDRSTTRASRSLTPTFRSAASRR
jgi:outer membrane protein TolC